MNGNNARRTGPRELPHRSKRRDDNYCTVKLVDRNKLPQVLAAQFPKDANLEVVRGACPDERASASRIYRVTLPGRKPLYMHVQMVVEDRAASFTTFEMEPERNKGWIC